MIISNLLVMSDKNHNPMFFPHWIHCSDSETVGQEAALILAGLLRNKPDASIVFPTGRTPTPLYQALRNLPAIHWSKSRLFQLDEYCPSTKVQSFAEWLDQALWQFIQPAQKYYLRDYYSTIEGWTRYEQLLQENNGPDLMILGIGMNGHIAFNEPGSLQDSRVRQVALCAQTLHDNFGIRDTEEVRRQGYPTEAVTLGIGTILSARQILLLGTGEHKRPILQQAFSQDQPPHKDCPASWLKNHPNVTVLTDF